MFKYCIFFYFVIRLRNIVIIVKIYESTLIAFFGNQKNDGGLELAKANKARSFYIPDPAEVKNAKISIEELTALKAKGGGASSEELEKLKKELEEEKKKPGNGSIDSQKAFQ